MKHKKEDEPHLFGQSSGEGCGGNSLFSGINEPRQEGSVLPPPSAPPPAPPAPAAAAARDAQALWASASGEICARLKAVEKNNLELKDHAAGLAAEISGLREASARDAQALASFCSAVETLKNDFAGICEVVAEERDGLESFLRSFEEDRRLRDASIAGFKEDLASIRGALRSVSVYGAGIEKALTETNRKYSEIDARLVRAETVSDRVRDFEAEVRAARLPEEKCAYLAGRLEGLDKRVSDVLGAHNCDADRLAGFCGRLGEMQSRMDQLSVMFGYFRDMADKLRQARPVDVSAEDPARRFARPPDQELHFLIDRII